MSGVKMLQSVTVHWIAEWLSEQPRTGQPLLVGLTGSVASGKSTLAMGLKQVLEAKRRVDQVSTDGFLLPNAVLAERGLSLRKGYPESYDQAGLARALTDIRQGPAAFPGYSHVTYDIDPALSRTLEPPDILILEGLGLPPSDARLDLLIYLDAAEEDLERWFLERFMVFWRAAETDPASFYAQFRTMDETQAEVFARSVWAGINLPNLRDHILPARDLADMVLRKDSQHQLYRVRP
jgi:type I pantothenate kinase